MWPLLLALAAATAAQGAQYGDYGAAKMPAYAEYEAPREPAGDDYRQRAAPAHTDYKDDDENKGNTDKSLSKDYRSGDSWQKPLRKQTKRTRNDDEYADREVTGNRGRDDGERTYSDRRERPLSKSEATKDGRARSKHKRGPDQAGAVDDEEFSIEKYIRGINENNLEADAAYSNRKTTDRIVRRKPRDRNVVGGPSGPAAFQSEQFDDDAALPSGPELGRAPNPYLKEIEVAAGSDDLLSDERTGRARLEDLSAESDAVRERAGVPGRARRPPALSDDAPNEGRGEQGGPPPRLRPAQRARLDLGEREGDYDSEYYDLKRLQNMRNIKPGSRRRIEAQEDEERELEDSSWAPIQINDPLDMESRRAFRPKGKKKGTKQWKKKGKNRSSTRRTSAARQSTLTRGTITARRTTTTRHTTTTTTTHPITSSRSTHRSPASTTTSTRNVVPSLTPAINGSTELSLAEKSRLSIMKKASRKEASGGPSTTKPPVLLQVTKVMPTVIMVEASVTEDPWMRAREVSGDSPDKLAKVKQMMRSKLVANAKDIRDLTEDWDQLVCDYVDVTLLESAALPRPRPHPAHVLFSVSLCVLVRCDVVFCVVSYIFKCALFL